MNHHSFASIAFSIFFAASLAGCSVVSAFSPTPTATVIPTATQTPLPTMTPTATEIPFYLQATVWTGNLQVPILLYHRFVPDTNEKSTSTKTRLADFKAQLQSLYDNGFSLISLQSWLDGTFTVPEGRKPLILTLDDGWFADQLYINDDGTPNTMSGLGVLWYFSQEHPDFGFSAAIFTNMGDKFYGDKIAYDRFILGEGDAWKDRLAKTIAWAVEHGISPYNHTFTHVELDLTANKDIVDQLKQNDLALREYLDRAGRSDLDAKLGNIIALPYGIWPATQSGIDILKNYKDPSGQQTEGIMEAYNLYEAVFAPSVFSPDYNPYNIPRLTAGTAMVDLVIEQKDQFPSASICSLGPLDESQAEDREIVTGLIQNAVGTGSCPAGVYIINGTVYVAQEGVVTLYSSPSEETKPISNTPEPTPTVKP